MDGRCEWCGKPVTAAATGRRARYCSAACRQRAYRERRRHRDARSAPATYHAREIVADVRRIADILEGRAQPEWDHEVHTLLSSVRYGLERLEHLAPKPKRRRMPTPPPTPAPAPRPKRPPKGALTEYLWRVVTEVYATGPYGLPVHYRIPAWPHLEERGRGFVTDDIRRAIPGAWSRRGPIDDDRRWLTVKGLEHIREHAERYAELYPDIRLREPAEVAMAELPDDRGLWQTMVDIALRRTTPTPVPGWGGLAVRLPTGRWRDRLLERGLAAPTGEGGRWELTAAGRAHYEAHWRTYRRRFREVEAPAPRDLPA